MPRDMPLSKREQYEAAATMHETLGLALDDLEATAKLPGYTIDMANWHKPNYSQERGLTCSVCLGAASLVQRYGIPIEAELDYDSMGMVSLEARKRALTMNCLREGNVVAAAMHFYQVAMRDERWRVAELLRAEWTPRLWGFIESPRFSKGGTRLEVFIALMHGLQMDLQEAGL